MQPNHKYVTRRNSRFADVTTTLNPGEAEQ